MDVYPAESLTQTQPRTSMKPIYLLLAATMTSSVYAATPISKYMGEWNQSSKYKPGQVVTYGQATWLCIAKQCLGVQPGTKPDAWITLGSNGQGVPGPQGPKGDTGPQGPQGPAGSGAGIKVYDANNQFLGYSINTGRNRYGIETIIPQINKVSVFSIGEDSAVMQDFTGFFSPSDGYYRYYRDVACNGPAAVEEYQNLDYNPDANLGSFLGAYKNEHGYLTKTAKFVGGAVLSVRYSTAECTPGAKYQIRPSYKQNCSGTFPVKIIDVVRDIDGTYGCMESRTVYPPNPQEQFVEYQFNPVTLPFTLPVALPLRYEVQQ